jgi:hypothetical protein
MKSRTAFILRRALLAVAIVPVAWLMPGSCLAHAWLMPGSFASGIGALIAREELHPGNAQGSTVTCRYIHAAGIYEMQRNRKPMRLVVVMPSKTACSAYDGDR